MSLNIKEGEEVDEFIKENYSKMTAKEIASKVNLSRTTVHNRIQKLGIRKGRYCRMGKCYKNNPASKGDQVIAPANDYINKTGRG